MRLFCDKRFLLMIEKITKVIYKNFSYIFEDEIITSILLNEKNPRHSFN